jgi:hypothetical protein
MATTYGAREARPRQPSGWAVGWTVFAATMMVIQGMWWMIAGLVGLFNDEFFAVTPEYILRFDLTTWGWIHLLLGILILAAGFALFSGAVWARVVGTIMAVLAMLIAFAWLPWYPLWGVLLIATSVAVVWSLTAHGRDISAPA